MEKAIRFHETGAPEVLKLENIEVGNPGPGEVRLRHDVVEVVVNARHQRARHPGRTEDRRPSGEVEVRHA